MGPMLAWLGKPDANIEDQAWADFMGRFAPLFYGVVVSIILLVLVMYYLSAKSRKIGSLGDVFAPYTPLNWIFLAIPGGLLACVLCYLQYPENFPTGRLGLSAEILFLACFMIALFSYLFIAFVPGLTPAKFGTALPPICIDERPPAVRPEGD